MEEAPIEETRSSRHQAGAGHYSRPSLLLGRDEAKKSLSLAMPRREFVRWERATFASVINERIERIMDKMLFSENMKLADLISANHNLILMLPRFGIPLGFGERSVARVCAAYDVPVDFFLLVCNVYTFDAYLPNRETLQSIDMRLLVPYLHASHQYYLRHLPYLGRLLDGMASKVDKRYGNMLRHFFAGYKNEVEEHFDYEEQVVFPYIERLRIASENGETLPESYHIHDYAEAHDNIEDKLNDLTQIIFKYLPGNVSPEDSIDVVFDIFQLSADLNKHALIEDRILVPYVEMLEAKRA